ncbi:PREDICTED: protein FATTY ACID EXPORT 3, chloroplastic-like isoform X2 [Tarenaya hassleriana]|uniref:protein FATTY ACID EXPORT 3, chloroplastic-like isoform X2 n=1 Tax=Tarenaya hassleriana TaxID=28532 RepID=UPI00053C57D3|nr:PREDICTED: protein FATTY ACID EXPORT 3, chloroplastic-like isoform X2 [Tarenaya hassleriana]
MELMSLSNLNPSSLNRALPTPPVTLYASSSLPLHLPLNRCRFRVPKLARALVPSAVPGFSFCYPYSEEASLNRSFVAFAASHEDSKHSEIEVEKEKSDIDAEDEVSQEAWKQAFASFKEQETSEQLRIQAEKAKQDLGALAKEIGEDGKEYILKAAEDSPAEVKEVIEAFASVDDLKDVSRVDDFHIGVPYGLLLFVGGFLSFMVTGSIAAIRFGVILGGAIFALSLASLKSQKKGESSTKFLKGQAGITTIIFLRELQLLLSRRCGFLGPVTTLISGGVLAFLVYKIANNKGKGTNLEGRAEN